MLDEHARKYNTAIMAYDTHTAILRIKNTRFIATIAASYIFTVRLENNKSLGHQWY